MKKILLVTFFAIAAFTSMASNIVTYGKELVRINFEKNHIEASINGGRSWTSRYYSSFCGIFVDLVVQGNDIVAVTSKGVYASTNGGRSWTSRYASTFCGTFQSIACVGNELLATTSKGLYSSTNGGRSWTKRR